MVWGLDGDLISSQPPLAGRHSAPSASESGHPVVAECVGVVLMQDQKQVLLQALKSTATIPASVNQLLNGLYQPRDNPNVPTSTLTS